MESPHTELPSSIFTPENTRQGGAGRGRVEKEAAYLVAGLGLPNENEGIRGDDGQAEVDEDDGPL